MSCNACGATFTRNATRQREHLAKCGLYLANMEALGKSNSITQEAGIKDTKQRTIELRPITPSIKASLDEKVALSIIMTASPFRFLLSPYTQDMFKSLLPGYNPPTRDDLATTLLDT